MAHHLTFKYHSFVSGHHVYCTAWTPVVGKELVVGRQYDNEHDEYAVAVGKDEEVVGHLPRERKQIISFFLAYDRNVAFCHITGLSLNRSVGLEVEVPCVYRFYDKKA